MATEVAAVAAAAATRVVAGKRLALAGVALSSMVGAARCAHLPHPSTPGTPGGVAATGSAPVADPLAALRAWENATRARTDFAHAKTSATALGADPYAIRLIRRGDAAGTGSSGATRLVGILRGRSELVVLDDAMRELERLPAPESPTGIAVTANGDVLVVGELSSRVARFRWTRGALEAAGSFDLPGVRAMRDVATGPEGAIYVVEEHDGRLLTLKPGATRGSTTEVRSDTPLCHGPIRVMRAARALLVDCLLDHAIILRGVDAAGFPSDDHGARIVHDGPMWGMDALDDGDVLWVAVGGVEDHPLDRTQGSFGFVDSFVTLYRVAMADGAVVKMSDVDTSAIGLVTPKALKLSRGGSGALELAVAGYGSDRLASLRWDPQRASGEGLLDPSIEVRVVPPGTAAMERLPDGGLVLANPLLDAWVRTSAAENAIAPVKDEPSRERTVDSRLGEALFFTTLMAPWDKADGRLSRFTCETCHFEGNVDGRTHYTGRGDIHATTKPLLGLFNNRPHFSRALDPDMTTMVNNEFRVAGAKSDHDPWFSLSTSAFPWLRDLAVVDETLTPERLRRALMTFLMDFTPRPNPAVVGRTRWSATERAGAEVFRDRCESCHEARLVTDDPTTRLPFEAWEERTMAREGAVVWARSDYEKTGVLPYVNEKGARVVSLRRLYKKYPYFTNGSAKDVRTVLDRVRFAAGQFFHDGAPDGAIGLEEDEKVSLAAFLDLL
jgi:hypothetical protein